MAVPLRERQRLAVRPVREGARQLVGAFGGEAVSILQYTSSAAVPGIAGSVDANAFRGSAADLRALAPGKPAPPPPNPPTFTEEDMPHGQLADGQGAITPIALPKGR